MINRGEVTWKSTKETTEVLLKLNHEEVDTVLIFHIAVSYKASKCGDMLFTSNFWFFSVKVYEY